MLRSFIDYNLRLDVLKISISCDYGAELSAIFERISDIWYDNNLVVPRHMLLIFNIEPDVNPHDISLLHEFEHILKLCSSKDFDRLNGCETLLLLYNAYTPASHKVPFFEHESNIILQISNKDSQIACCHGINSPFFNQFCFKNDLKPKVPNELYKTFYGQNEIYEIKRKLNYVNSIFDSQNPMDTDDEYEESKLAWIYDESTC